MSSAFRNVLVVDDDPSILQFLSKILTNSGYDVVTAESGEAAVQILGQQRFHFLLTDFNMPGMNGAQLCQQMRELDLPRYVYTMVITASPTCQVTQCLKAGADDFIKKPFAPDELLARMTAGLRVLEMEARLRYLVSFDSLTETLNRRTFFESLDTIWPQEPTAPATCVMIDVDRFKFVNDTYGHIAGDIVLCGVADIIRSSFTDTELVGRYGGEEFCIYLNHTSMAQAWAIAEHARNKIAKHTFDWQDAPIRVTASMGLAERTADDISPRDLIYRADQAMIQAKRRGRNQSVVVNSSILSRRINIPVVRTGIGS
ncbi:MAG: diguanylate cyclase [Planctomycetales bacterium]|nr:diguanylate cyclase [Planctomycetales bacterium]